MLYQSLYVPVGSAPFDRSILDQPEIAQYVKDWGRPNDSGFVAVDDRDQPIGAIWLRLFSVEEKGFGYVNDQTPELGMAVLPEYRGQGVGTSLLSRLIEWAEDHYENISLSVASENPARRLYERHGFIAIGKHGDSVTMMARIRQHIFGVEL